jgi:glycosyltransferase involved in cell wall biosynthesis
MMQKPSLIQVPRPGTQYSASKGSAISTVIYEMAQAAQRQGVSTRVILKRGVACDYPVGEGSFVDFGELPRRWQRRADDGLARWNRSRVFMPRFYAPALDGIEGDFTGPVFFHDNFEALHPTKQARPNAKICAWLHNYKWRHLQDQELKRAFDSTHRIVCVSDFVAQALLSECGHLASDLEKKVAVVLNGVDTQRFKPIPHDLQDSSTPVTITFAGRMIEKKGVHLLLEAAQILQADEATRNFKLRFIGSKSIQSGEKLSPYEQQLRERVQTLGDKVEWVGAVAHNAMPQQLALSDIVCVPSIWNDPCPLTTLEGMASGAVLVASSRGGIPEVGGDAAMLFEQVDGPSLALVLAKLIKNPTLREESKLKSRQRALELTWDRSFEALCQQVF